MQRIEYEIKHANGITHNIIFKENTAPAVEAIFFRYLKELVWDRRNTARMLAEYVMPENIGKYINHRVLKNDKIEITVIGPCE